MNQSNQLRETQIVSVDELATRLPSGVPPWITAGILSISGMQALNREHAKLGSAELGHNSLFEEALSRLSVRLNVDEASISRIPRQGPVIVIANHPFGGIDGLALGATMLRCRSDVRIMTNSLLSRITKLTPWFLDVSVFDGRAQAGRNARQLRLALKHLNSGGMLVVFPAGEVSHFQPRRMGVEDSEWSQSVAMLARRCNAPILPCFFEGANSAMFQAAGLIHPSLRTILLPREMLARRGTPVTLKIGQVVPAATFTSFEDDEVMTAWLRLRCYDLQTPSGSANLPRYHRPISGPRDPKLIKLELSELPTSQKLIDAGRFQVYFARRVDIPETLEEIARLREQTFRAVGEGTGATMDRDPFDDSYHHLVLYDREAERIAGAYRVAFCDEILDTHGFEGLYTNQLFRFRGGMRKMLASAIELGRSFVRQEYQRQPSSLALLWRGIGELLLRYPRYHRLIGPASISGRYRGSARRLLLAYLRAIHGDPGLQRLVEPRLPVDLELDATERTVLTRACKSRRELSRLLGQLNDAQLRPIPVLIERYLELGAKVAGFNVDPNFNHCVDALVAVDVDAAPEAVLRRFLGNAGYENRRYRARSA
ncbi:MAG: GNAT family N-acyltransferase [Polyangiaceae bacterium]